MGGAWTIKQCLYTLALAMAVVFGLLHLVSIPIGITYDGLEYIKLSDIVGSSQFPARWSPPRAPLFPLALKATFYLVGRQPLAPILLSTSLGLLTILLLTAAARRICGYAPAAAVAVLISFYPTFIAYQHFVLTEAGTTFFLSFVIFLLVWQPVTSGERWQRSILIGAVLSTGYYWRETLQTLAFVAAPLHALSCLTPIRPLGSGRYWRSIILQTVLIIAAPYLAGSVWSHVIDNSAWKKMALRQGLFRQAFIPASDRAVVTNAPFYEDAIRQSVVTGNFYSGLRSDLLDKVFEKSCSASAMDDPQSAFLRAMRQYPSRYAAAAVRTAVLLAGWPGALESENRIFRGQIFDGSGSKIGEGPPDIHDQVIRQFDQKSTDCLVLRFLRTVTGPYDALIPIASLLTVLGLFWGCAIKDIRLVACCALPLFYLSFYVLILDSIDRYAAPAYPMMLANCVILPMSVLGRLKARIPHLPGGAAHS